MRTSTYSSSSDPRCRQPESPDALAAQPQARSHAMATVRQLITERGGASARSGSHTRLFCIVRRQDRLVADAVHKNHFARAQAGRENVAGHLPRGSVRSVSRLMLTETCRCRGVLPGTGPGSATSTSPEERSGDPGRCRSSACSPPSIPVCRWWVPSPDMSHDQRNARPLVYAGEGTPPGGTALTPSTPVLAIADPAKSIAAIRVQLVKYVLHLLNCTVWPARGARRLASSCPAVACMPAVTAALRPDRLSSVVAVIGAGSVPGICGGSGRLAAARSATTAAAAKMTMASGMSGATRVFMLCLLS